MIPRRPLGDSGIEVSAIGLGCMGMSDFYGVPDDDRSVATIHRALDLGVNLLDTADVYGIGANETLLRRALDGRRAEAVVATKFGLVRDADGAWKGVRGDPAYVRACCEASLARLGVETIDLYYQHRVDPGVPIEETVGEMARLVEEGKARALGLSEAGPETLARACAVHPIAALQSEYSLWTRDPEAAVLPRCVELGVTFVAYSPLGRGMLTATLSGPDEFPDGDYRRKTPRFEPERFEANRALAERVREAASSLSMTPAQVALAWVIAKGDGAFAGRVLPIPGTKRIEYLEQNLGALERPLDRATVAALDEAFPLGAASGTRYPEFRMGELGR